MRKHENQQSCVRRIGFALAVMFLAIGSPVASAANPVDIVSEDLGTIEATVTTADTHFDFTNPLSTPLTVEHAVTTCHCTTVEYAKEPIAPNASIRFNVHIDLRSMTGNSMTGFLVHFKDVLHAPIFYKVRLNHLAPLHATPKTVDFGIERNPGVTVRTFQIMWMSDVDHEGLRILKGIRAEKDTADCRLIDQKEQVQRPAYAARDVKNQQFTFEVKLHGNLTSGDLDESIVVPVSLDGAKTAVVVPVRASIVSDLYSAPTNWVEVVSDPARPIENKISLYGRDVKSLPEDVTVSCGDKAFGVEFSHASVAEAPLLGTVQIKLLANSPVRSRVETEVHVMARSGNQPITLALPVTIIFASGMTNVGATAGLAQGDNADFDLLESQAKVAPAIPAASHSTLADSTKLAVRIEDIDTLGPIIRDYIETLRSSSPRKAGAPPILPILHRMLRNIAEVRTMEPEAGARLSYVEDSCLVLLLNLRDADGEDRVQTLASSEREGNAWIRGQGIRVVARAIADRGNAALQGADIDQLVSLNQNHTDNDSLTSLSIMLYPFAATPELAKKLDLASRLMQGNIARELRQSYESANRMKVFENRPLKLSGVTADGRAFNISQFRGKVVLIDFWATWCVPCRAEIPQLQDLYAKYHAAGLEIVGISNDFELASLQDYIVRNNIRWTQLFDAGAAENHQWNLITRSLGIGQIPMLFLVGRDGVLKETEAQGNLEASIQNLLGQKQ